MKQRFSTRVQFSTACTTGMLVLLAACGSDADKAGRQPLGATNEAATAQGELPPGLNAVAAAHLDSGNVAFRMQRYDEAQAFYRAAVTDVPMHPAPWYGIYMVAQATGNRQLADSAMRAFSSRQGGNDLLDANLASAHKTGGTPK